MLKICLFLVALNLTSCAAEHSALEIAADAPVKLADLTHLVRTVGISTLAVAGTTGTLTILAIKAKCPSADGVCRKQKRRNIERLSNVTIANWTIGMMSLATGRALRLFVEAADPASVTGAPETKPMLGMQLDW